MRTIAADRSWLLAVALALALAPGCAFWPGEEAPRSIGSEPYRPDRRDYMTFREAWPALLEPNYLPFMVHRIPGEPPVGDPLLFCRWPESAMPLPIYVEEADVPAELQDEFNPVSPELYTEAVLRALRTWESELEGLVRFARVDDPEKARLVLRVRGEVAPAPEPEIRVLGTTEALLQACRPRGWDPDSERMEVSFEVPQAILYAADDFGLLTPTQVEAIALHELGHALGMMGHSPVPADLMYRILGERTSVEALSTADVNSFVSLYRLPNGTHYGYVPPGAPSPRPEPGPPTGEPALSMAPHVDARQGFELRTPAGWMRAADSHGVFASNGPIWDHDASFEIFVWPQPTIESYLQRFGPALFAGTWHRHRAPLVVDGRRAIEIAVEDPSGRTAMDFIFVELGDGRVMVILSQCPVEVYRDWRPWFQASLASLEIWQPQGRGSASGAGGRGLEGEGRR